MSLFINGIRVGVQSWCFRSVPDNRDVIKALKELGLDGIEMCGIHFNPDSIEQAEKVFALYNAEGISITAFGVDGYPNNETTLRKKFEVAKKSNFKTVGADPDPDAYDLIDMLSKEYGVKLAIHNHGDHHRYGSAKQLTEAFNNSTDSIGLCLDTAWALQAGEDPASMIRKFSGRLYGIHLKDFIFDKDNNYEDVPLGTGALKLDEVMAALKEINFKGYVTIEYEGEPPVPAIAKCIEELKKYS